MNDESSSQNGAPRGLLDRLTQMFGSEPKDRDDVLQVLRDAQQRELLSLDALSMIQGVFEVADMQARDIMIPRSHMVVVEHDQTLEQMLPIIIESGHSRFPVIGDSRDEVEGILLAKDLLRFYFDAERENFHLTDILRPAVFVPESKRLNQLLKDFRASRNHMAVVVDEYSGVAGLVTIEDVLEQIVGEIDDEHDTEEDAMIRRVAADHYHVHALTPIEDFNEYFGVGFSDEEYDTIGGLVMAGMGRVPRVGDSLPMGGFRFTVTAADSRRVHSLEVQREDDQGPGPDAV